jgi:branched-chain amino acid transport system ATP-binding protein
VLVEQNVRLALEIADEIVIINSGAVAHRGRAASLKSDDAVIARNHGVH